MLSILLQVPRRQNLWLRMATNSAWSTWIFSCRRLRAILDIFYFFDDFIWIGFFEVSNVVNQRIPTQHWKKNFSVTFHVVFNGTISWTFNWNRIRNGFNLEDKLNFLKIKNCLLLFNLFTYINSKDVSNK